MKSPIVILVLAAKAPSLQGLLDLVGGRFHVVVHLDAKSGMLDIRLPEGAVMTRNRFPVFWGGFNMILAIREMIETAYAEFPYFDRLVTITGDTLPVQNLDTLEHLLTDSSIEYMYLSEVRNDPLLRGLAWKEAVEQHALIPWRFQNYVWSDDELHSPRSRDDTIKKFGVTPDQADALRNSVQARTGEILRNRPPRPDLFPKIFYGNSWWGLTRQSIDLIIDDSFSEINISYFQYLNVPDEHFFQTLLGNKTRALNSLGRKFEGKCVFVDYDSREREMFTGNDYLDKAGFKNASNAQWLFARKYNPSRTPEIVEYITSGQFFTEITLFSPH